jgi:hypothetical protein
MCVLVCAAAVSLTGTRGCVRVCAYVGAGVAAFTLGSITIGSTIGTGSGRGGGGGGGRGSGESGAGHGRFVREKASDLLVPLPSLPHRLLWVREFRVWDLGCGV